MTVEQAKVLLASPLAFGNSEQIQALRQLEAANRCAKFIRELVYQSNFDGLPISERMPEYIPDVTKLVETMEASLTFDLLFEEVTGTDRGWEEIALVADEKEHTMLKGWQSHILKCVKKAWNADAKEAVEA